MVLLLELTKELHSYATDPMPHSSSVAPEPGLPSFLRGETAGIVVGFLELACIYQSAKLGKNCKRSKGIAIMELPELNKDPGFINPCRTKEIQGILNPRPLPHFLNIMLLSPLLPLASNMRKRQPRSAWSRETRPLMLSRGHGPRPFLYKHLKLAICRCSSIRDNAISPSQRCPNLGHRCGSCSTRPQRLLLAGLPAAHLA